MRGGARAAEKGAVYPRVGFAFTDFLPAVGIVAREFRRPRARPTAGGAVMLKNALIFAVAALTIAFAAPSLFPGRAARVAAPAPAPAPLAPAPTNAAVPAGSVYREASLPADPGGQFRASVSIEGQDVDVLVDTGATMVALTAETAERLGVVADPWRPKLPVSTANGISLVSPVVLREVSLGAIDLNDVEAVVMAPGAATANLLGASFLKRLVSVEQRDGALVLRQ
jgi:aspartyl protease family protein